MHGDSKVGINIKKLLDQLVRKFRCDNIQIGYTAIHISRLKAVRIAEIKSRRCNIVLDRLTGFCQILKRKTERLHGILIKIFMQDAQSFLSVQSPRKGSYVI